MFSPSVFLNSVLLASQCPHVIEVVCLSVGLVDVWPPSMGFSSFHAVPVPSGVPVVLLCCLLKWVVCLLPPDGFSACYVVPTHVNTMSLTTFGLCSMVVNSALKMSSRPLPPLDIL